jgi:hypothetical protein
MLLFALVALHALIFHKNVYADSAAPPPAHEKLAASFSIALWLGILSAGRAIGYVAGRPDMYFK